MALISPQNVITTITNLLESLDTMKDDFKTATAQGLDRIVQRRPDPAASGKICAAAALNASEASPAALKGLPAGRRKATLEATRETASRRKTNYSSYMAAGWPSGLAFVIDECVTKANPGTSFFVEDANAEAIKFPIATPVVWIPGTAAAPKLEQFGQEIERNIVATVQMLNKALDDNKKSTLMLGKLVMGDGVATSISLKSRVGILLVLNGLTVSRPGG